VSAPARRVKPPDALVQALRRAGSVVLVTHLNPDGDGLGSEAALGAALRAMGKTVAVANNDPVPGQYAFLGLDAFAPGGSGQAHDLAVSLDCPVLERLGPMGQAAFAAARERAVIDHHVPKDPFGDFPWIEEKSAATGEMIEALLPELGLAPSPAMATALYAAIVHDTGCFRHSNTDAFVFAAAVRLLEAGADSRGVNRRLLDEKPLRQVRLQARALGGLRSLAGGRAALVTVSAAELAAEGATWEDTDGLAEALRSIEGVEVGAMLREEGPLAAKLSVRSKYSFDVNVFAQAWGGGGHAKAAGATLRMPFDQAVEAVSRALQDLPSAGSKA
jgi:phosphoesterase RecJ-like protein